jgi:transposase
MPNRLDPEKVAYWYFRLNGFFQIENFVVHPERNGSQRTDADLLAVRFPHRAERLFDNPNDIMADDQQRLLLSRDLIDVLIAEVKTNDPCTLNGPWTQLDRRNVHRVLAAIGCFPAGIIEQAAADIYRTGVHVSDLGLRIRLVAVGRDRCNDLAAIYPEVVQLIWTEMLAFVWDRLHRYRQQKAQVDQWDAQGKEIKRLADRSHDEGAFIERALHLMGVRNDNPAL